MTKQEINYIKSSDVNIDDATPVMKQYLEIKREHQDVILLYRLGDFYETFFEDALTMSKVLEITLTGKDCGQVIGRVPLAGIPAKAIDGYLEKLINNNYKVAICEQLEDPKSATGLVKRGVTRIVTTGTLTEGELLQKDKNNYICSMVEDKKSGLYGFCYADISTGEFKLTQASFDLIRGELARINPSEIIGPSKDMKVQPFQIVPEKKIDLPDEVVERYNCSMIPSNVFEEKFAYNNLKSLYSVQTLDSFGYNDYKVGFRAAAALLSYIWENLKDNFAKFDKLATYELKDFVIIDSGTRRNLELTETLRERNKYGSLLWAIDKTKTNMGARLLRNWICQPLKNLDKINERLNIVEELIEKSDIRNTLRDKFEGVYDIQRIATKINNNTATPRDYISLKNSLYNIPDIAHLADELECPILNIVKEKEVELTELCHIIERTIVDEPPIQIKDGGIIKEGVNGELDYLKNAVENQEEWLRNFEEEEREKTGISKLKVGYNKVFGYFIEVTNSFLNLVPEDYIRKQTLTGGERFITDKLKKHEDIVLTSQFKSKELEYKLYSDFKNYTKEYVETIRKVAECIAESDVLANFAQISLENNYVKPVIDDSQDFFVKNGRHPVLEKILPMGTYVSNDLNLSKNDTEFMILTGPNMAGKSTYMRQNALIIILAQCGCFVPADSAKIGIADKIFTRVGASDDLTLGQSTFMVEMIETSYILNTATEKSFILLDEIGRGTSTYDGVAIAWAVAEFIATKIQARTIFATHYHELNVMTKTYPMIKNYRITVAEQNGEIEFLRKIVQGGASQSYGIQVAKMAGLPKEVVNRSMDLMTKMQKDFSKNLTQRKKTLSNTEDETQLNLF